MSEPLTDAHRIAKLETDFTVLSNEVKGIASDLSAFVGEQRDFRQEWRRQKEAEAAQQIDAARASAENAKAGRVTLPQFITMGSSIAGVTVIIIGGLMWMIQNETKAARNDAIAQVTQLGLQVRGQADTITSTQTALQVFQRDTAIDRVKLGLVEQSAANSARLIQSMEGYDAVHARQDEQIKALQQAIRDIAGRMQRP
jgi:hypothetical protein